MLPCEEVLIGFPDDFRLILETGPGKHCAIRRHKTAVAVFKINVVRELVHQRGQEMSLAERRGGDAMSLRDVPAKVCRARFIEGRRYVSNGCRSARDQFSEFVFSLLREVTQSIIVEGAHRSRRTSLQGSAQFRAA